MSRQKKEPKAPPVPTPAECAPQPNEIAEEKRLKHERREPEPPPPDPANSRADVPDEDPAGGGLGGFDDEGSGD
jgi:hypothetical protein